MRYKLLIGLMALGTAACGLAMDDGEEVGFGPAAIQGGSAAGADTGVVFVFVQPGTSCTGVLLAPNVVLTSRICVAQALSGGPGGSPFDPPVVPTDVQVVAAQDAMDAPTLLDVAEVQVPPNDNDVYQGNLAVLLLDEPLSPSEATPLTPRFDQAPQQGESYSVVGYGNTCPTCNDSGERRRLDGLQVDCVSGCSYPTAYEAYNFVGGGGLCQGDAGAPAIDGQNQVFGLGFAGASDCGAGDLFASIDPFEDFLVQAALDGAELGCYEPPTWAGGSGPGTGGYGCGGDGPGGSGGSATGGGGSGIGGGTGGSGTGGSGTGASPAASTESDENSGCSCSTRGAPPTGWALGMGLALLGVVLRRRSAT